MKKVEGHFGTGVTSYFLFLKWIFLLNIPVFILTFGFVVFPQILFTYNLPNGTSPTANRTSFSGAELLTGAVSTQILDNGNIRMKFGQYDNRVLFMLVEKMCKFDLD